MLVEVIRSGGVAGIIRTWAVEIDQTPDPAGLLMLIQACPWDIADSDALGSDPPAGHDRLPGNDQFVYLLRAGQRSATLAAEAVQGPWRELIDRVQQFSIGHGRGLRKDRSD